MWKAESRAAAEEDGEKVWKWDMKGEKNNTANKRNIWIQRDDGC